MIAPSPSPARAFTPQFIACGESALIITLGEELSLAVNAAAIAVEDYLKNLALPYILESVPLLRSVFIRYDGVRYDFDTVVTDLHPQIVAALKDEPSSDKCLRKRRLWHLPVCYADEYAPDLDTVARHMERSSQEVIALHSSEILHILMLGFAPGWIYSGLHAPLWDIPRLVSAKPHVAAGSLSVAVRQTVISTIDAPTGWYTIGRTPYLNFDLRREPACTMVAGDAIKIETISPREFTLYRQAFARGERVLLCAAED